MVTKPEFLVTKEEILHFKLLVRWWPYRTQFRALGLLLKYRYYTWVKLACSCRGLKWPFHRFSGGFLWMQRGIPAMAQSGGNTVLYNLGSNGARNFKSVLRFALVQFWNYWRDYSLNCTPLDHSIQLLLLIDLRIMWVSDYEKFKLDACNWTAMWSCTACVTNKRAENQLWSRILL